MTVALRGGQVGLPWDDETTVLGKLGVHPDFGALVFPPLRKGGQVGLPWDDETTVLDKLRVHPDFGALFFPPL
jgi:hypothetical protein